MHTTGTRSGASPFGALILAAGLLAACTEPTQQAAPADEPGYQATGYKVSTDAAANSVNFVQAFNLSTSDGADDVFYAAVAPGTGGATATIAVIHQHADLTIEKNAALVLTDPSVTAITPGSLQVSSQFTSAGNPSVAVTAIVNENQVATWNVSRDDDNTIGQSAFSNWLTAPANVLSMAAFQATTTIGDAAQPSAASPTPTPTVSPASDLTYPAKAAVRWFLSGVGYCTSVYDFTRGLPLNLAQQSCVNSTTNVTRISAVVFSGTQLCLGQPTSEAFLSMNGAALQLDWWNASGALSNAVSTVPTNVGAILVARFATVGDQDPDIGVAQATRARTRVIQFFSASCIGGSKPTVGIRPTKVPAKPITLSGMASLLNLSYGIVGYGPQGTPTPMFATPVSRLEEGSPVPQLAAWDKNGAPLANVAYPAELQAKYRPLVGSVSIGNYLGGYAALLGVTGNGRLGLYGYNANLSGFDQSYETAQQQNDGVRLAIPAG